MTPQKIKLTFALLALATMMTTSCAKKSAKAEPPAVPPPPAAPTATLAANPAVIQQGQQTTLTWQTQNANTITIEGLGTLSASGSRVVTPSSSTTYNLVAKGPGGTSDASTRVTVNMATASIPNPSEEELFAKNVRDVYFDYDKANIRPSEEAATEGNVAFFQDHKDVKFLVEGHCDDRGSEEYNVALGTSRAQAVKQSLMQHGVSADRIQTISYGKERPFCTEDNEQCWQRNRVGHIVFQR